MTTPVVSQIEVQIQAIDAVLKGAIAPSNATGVAPADIERVRGALRAFEGVLRSTLGGTSS